MFKLYVFSDPRFSLDSYVVMAESEEQAKSAVLAKLNEGIGPTDTWAKKMLFDRYEVESFGLGHVITIELPTPDDDYT